MTERPKTSPEAAQVISGHLKNARDQVASQKQAASTATKRKDIDEVRFQVSCRDALVSELRQRADVLESLPKIFISYSGNPDPFYTDAKAYFESKDFRVVHWRDPEQRNDEYIVPDIAQRIAACSCFLGIWTGYYSLNRANSSEKRIEAPRVWMPLELGMAIANGAICKVFVHKDVHVDFISDANLGKYNEQFDDKNFGEMLKAAERTFRKELKNRPPRWSRTSPLDHEYD